MSAAALSQLMVSTPTAIVRTRTPLRDAEKDLLATLIATLTDPGLADVRDRVMAGELALRIEDGEVSWFDVEHEAAEVANAIGRRLR